MTQNHKNKYVDQIRTSRAFEEGYMIYIRLQPYRKYTPKGSNTEKLQPTFFGPYKILTRLVRLPMNYNYPRIKNP